MVAAENRLVDVSIAKELNPGAWQAWWSDRLRELPPTALNVLAGAQGFAVTTAQARDLGLSRDDTRREVRRGALSTPARGVLSPVVLAPDDSTPTSLRRMTALAATSAVLLRPGQVVTGRSGAILHGLPTFAVPDSPELTARRMTSGRRQRTHIYRAALPEVDIGSWFGTPVSTAARTVTELARHDRRDAIMAADAALRWRLATLPDMMAVLDREVGWPYSRRARELLVLADGRAESPLESVARLAFHDDGFPAPEPQYVIGPYRVDFCWPEFRFIVEADGRGKYADDDEKWNEKRREIALRRMGFRVERVVWADIVTNAAWRSTSAYLRREMRG